MRYLLLRKKVPQNLSGLKNQHLLSHTFCGPGAGNLLSCVVLAQDL